MSVDVIDTPLPNRARRRRSDVQEKLYSLLNRSAQSITRTNSQNGKPRRQEPEVAEEEHLQPRASRADDTGTPRLSTGSNVRNMILEQSPRSNRSLKLKSSNIGSANRPLVSTSALAKKSFERSYTPPRTPSSSRHASHPSPPSSVRGIPPSDLLLIRSVSRPTTPSSSSNAAVVKDLPTTPTRKVLGITLPSPSLIRRTSSKETTEEKARRTALKAGGGSNDSNEPLLGVASHSRTQTSESSNARTSTSSGVRPNLQKERNIQHVAEGKLPTPVSLSKSRQPVATADPASPTADRSAKGSKFDFLRTVAPKPSLPQSPRDTKLRQRTISTRAHPENQADLHSPQARRAMGETPTFLPSVTVPQLRRTPPTPQREGSTGGLREARIDSFLSDSVPLPMDTIVATASQGPSAPRQPAFTRTKEADGYVHAGMGIERSRSVPGVRGRLSPCLRIPSPKFFTKDRSRSNSRSRDGSEKKSQLSVGAPILREPRTHVHMHAHASPRQAVFNPRDLGAIGANDSGIAVETNVTTSVSGGLKGGKTSLTHIRRTAHGTFDFERPGSRTSDKSGHDDSMGTHSNTDEEHDRDEFGMILKQRNVNVSSSTSGRSKSRTATQPVPPLPSNRLKERSPPAQPAPDLPRRTRSPHDDSALPRLSSGLSRRNSGQGSSAAHTYTHAYTHAYTPSASPGRHRGHASLPAFSFEPATSTVHTIGSGIGGSGGGNVGMAGGGGGLGLRGRIPEKPIRDVSGGTYVDTHTGLIMWASPAPSERSPPGSVSGRGAHRARTGVGGERGRSGGGGVRNGHGHGNGHSSSRMDAHTKIDSKELEEATAVIMQFKSALDDAGFVTLQKYVRRYDAHIMPLEGSSGLLVRVQRLLDMSAPRTDERRKRDLMQQFTKVVTQVS